MKVDDGDFAIILSPEKDSDNKWNGAINVKSMFNTDAWKEDEIRTVLEMVTLLTSCIPLLERDDPFLHKVQVEREELINNYCELIVDGMDYKTLEVYAKEQMSNYMDSLSLSDIKEDIDNYNPELFDELVDDVGGKYYEE